MKTYLVFEPADGIRDAAAVDRVIFLRERFSWVALFFTAFWLLWHRLWLALIAWLAAIFVIVVTAHLFGVGEGGTALLVLIPSILIAFEATELRRRKLVRRGYRAAAVMVAADLEAAERNFFANWTAAPSARPPAPVGSAQFTGARAGQTAPNPVIGLFPEPGGGR